MAKTPKDSIKTRKIAVLAGPGVDDASLNEVKKALEAAGGKAEIVSVHLGEIKTPKGVAVPVKHSLLTASSVLFDAVYVPGGKGSVDSLNAHAEAVEFVKEAYQHCKTIGAYAEGVDFAAQSIAGCKDRNSAPDPEQGLVFEAKGQPQKFTQNFIKAIAQHRHWDREPKP